MLYRNSGRWDIQSRPLVFQSFRSINHTVRRNKTCIENLVRSKAIVYSSRCLFRASSIISLQVNQQNTLSLFLKCLYDATTQKVPTCFDPERDHHQGTRTNTTACTYSQNVLHCVEIPSNEMETIVFDSCSLMSISLWIETCRNCLCCGVT
jgi:hypothetical protein